MGLFRFLNQWREKKDGTLEGPALSTEKLSNARIIHDGHSHADIETKLSSSGTVVWMPGDYSTLPDRVEITAADIDLHIMEGAHIAVDPDADPTLVQADNRTSPDGQWLFVIYNNGYNNVDIHNQGLIEGRRWSDPDTKSGVVFEYVACIGTHNADNCSLYNYGSDLYNTSIGASWVDCSHFEINDPYSSTLRESPAELEGCEHFQINNPRTVASNEGVNLNAYNEYYHVSGIVADGGGEDNTTGIEIEESPHGTVDGINARNGCDKVALIAGMKQTGTDASPDVTDPKFTDKTPAGHCNDVTIDNVTGTVSATAITANTRTNGNPIRDLHIDGNVTSTGGRAIELLADTSAPFDGARIGGRYETEASGERVAYLNNGGDQCDSLQLNATFVGVDKRAEIDDWDHVKGDIEVRNVRLLIFAGSGLSSSHHDLHVIVEGSGGRGLHVNGSGTLADNNYRGRCHNNSGPDVELGDGTDIRIDIDYESRFIGGVTRSVWDGLGYNDGDPSSTGQWSGNGYEGLRVRDTTNNNTYLYNDGSWSQIASA
jgi:hypothetical protein